MTGIATGFDAIKRAVAGAPAPERDARPRTGWEVVDEGWGRRAVDFATLSEPGNCREYVAIHHRLGISEGDRLVDVACGAGLALELADVRGAACAGIDASHRLVAVARDRNPDADIRVGDMHALPWDDASFDVATSFRGIWATTPAAVSEIHRVLVPGGRVGLTVWGHIRASPGAWALASTGPAYEAIQNVGEAAFIEAATDQARKLVRDGLPLRAPIAVAGYLARKPRPRRKASR